MPRLLLKFQQGVFAKIPERKLERLLRIPILNRAVTKRVLRKLGLDTVINAACGAAPLPPEILLWYRKLGLNLAEGYGMTETLITHLPAPGSVRPGFVGCAIPGVEAKLSEDGELLIRSPMNMLGYYKRSGKHAGLLHRRTASSAPAIWPASSRTASSRSSAASRSSSKPARAST